MALDSLTKEEFQKRLDSSKDKERSFRELMSDDLMTGAPIEAKCLLQPYRHGEYNQNQDYHNCSQSKCEECAVYKRYKPLER